MASIRKLFCDSRYAMTGSSTSRWTTELPETVETYEDCVCFLTSVTLPVAWPSVGPNNCNIYLLESSNPIEVTSQYFGRICPIAQGTYDAPSRPRRSRTP